MVKIVSFLVIFYPVKFPFSVQKATSHLLCSSCSRVLLFLADMLESEFHLQLRPSELLQFCFAKLRHKTHYLHPQVRRTPWKSPLAEGWNLHGKSEVRVEFHILFFAAALQWPLPVTKSYLDASASVGQGAGGTSFGVPAHQQSDLVAQEIWYFLTKRRFI